MFKSKLKKPIRNITAIIYDKRGRVLSIGKNSYTKTHTMQSYYAHRVGLPCKQYLHAEIDAIIRCKDLSKAHTIFVARVDKSGSYRMAKPCKVCQCAIDATGIENIIWTTNNDGEVGMIGRPVTDIGKIGKRRRLFQSN